VWESLLTKTYMHLWSGGYGSEESESGQEAESGKNGGSEPEPETDDDRREELEPDSESDGARTIIIMLGITTWVMWTIISIPIPSLLGGGRTG